MQPLTELEFQQISQLLHRQCGIYLQPDQDYLIETRLSDFARSLGLQSFSDLFSRLQAAPDKYLPTVISLMTTNETLWFRDESCWNALEKAILPTLMKKSAAREEVKIWIAGCSTGQEAYSLAILIDELCKEQGQLELARRFQIQAMDISQAALEAARRAKYNNFEINRGLSITRRNHYFEQQDDGFWVLRPHIRLRVQFETINLTHDFSYLGQYDLILCRNVTIYFTPEVRRRILNAMMSMLKADGALFIGATESLWEERNLFKVSQYQGCMYVQPNK